MKSSDVNGILNILKPPGMTSFDVIRVLRGILKVRKMGHTGTLDPAATGVLPVCIGTATKAIEFMMSDDKLYRAELTLGISTDTQDSCGKVVKVANTGAITEEHIRKAINSYIGKILQVPPMYSALKIGGKKLYELARAGISVEREPREIEIYSIDIVSMTGMTGEENKKIIFDAACSKGTYIRTLCADIGEKLGCGGHMSSLVRLRSGVFEIGSAITLEEVAGYMYNESGHEHYGSIYEKLINVDEIFKRFHGYKLDGRDKTRFINGGFLPVDVLKIKDGEILRIYDEDGKFIAIGEAFLKQGKLFLKVKKLFVLGEIDESNIQH